MKIRLDQVDEPFVWREALEIPGGELGLSEPVEIGEVTCRGTIRAMTEGFLLRAALSYRQQLCCTRCLRPVTIPIEHDLDLILEIGGDESPEQDLELERDDLGVLRLDKPILDTRPIILEQVQLSLPMKPLCKEDCAGLCVSCGADLNAGPCGCEPAGDTRWQALAALKGSS